MIFLAVVIFTAYTVSEINDTNARRDVTRASFNPVRRSGGSAQETSNSLSTGNFFPFNNQRNDDFIDSVLGYSFYLSWVTLAFQILNVILNLNIFRRPSSPNATNAINMS